MSAWPANSRTSCIVAPLRIASLLAVVRSEGCRCRGCPAAMGRSRPPRNIFLDHPPGGLAVQVPPLEAATVWPHGPKERAFPVIPDTGLRHVGAAPYRPAEPEG